MGHCAIFKVYIKHFVYELSLFRPLCACASLRNLFLAKLKTTVFISSIDEEFPVYL